MSSTYTVNFNAVPKNADTYQPFELKDTDLTGGTFAMALRNLKGALITTFTIGDGIEIVDAATGKFAVHLLKTRLATLVHGLYNHDLLYTDSGGNITRVWEGSFNLKQGVTP